MISLGLCDRRYFKSGTRVVGSRPLLCPPPLTRDILWPNWGLADFVYIDLHGDPDEPEWLRADGERVLHVRDVVGLPKKVVFATTCYMPQTAFYDALRENSVLVCGDSENIGERSGRAIGAPLLALWFRRFLSMGYSVDFSLRGAKLRVFLTSWARSSDFDALKFYIAPPLGAAKETT